MDRRAFLALLAGTLGCRDTAGPAWCGMDDDIDKVGARLEPVVVADAVRVADTQGFYEALRAGQSAIELTAPVYVSEPITLDDYPFDGSHFALVGVGGYTGSGLIARAFDGPAPVLAAGASRPWEIRLRGLAFYGAADRYPQAGPSLRLDYMQHSTWDDVRFQYHACPFVVGAVMLNSFDVDSLFVMDATAPGEMRNAGDFRIRGGAIEKASLAITGPARGTPNSYPGPGLVEDVHMEFATLAVRGVDDLAFRGGYRLASEIRFDDCGGRFDFRPSGTWAESRAYRDGRLIYPVRC